MLEMFETLPCDSAYTTLNEPVWHYDFYATIKNIDLRP